MKINTAPDPGQFRTSALRSPPGRVDRERKVIHGAKLMQLGPLNDNRPWTVDNETLQMALGFVQEPARGLKARWTHPNLSGDGLGKYLGRWQGARISGGALLADLHLAESAFNTPRGDLGTYVMDLAEEDPDAFGVSLATRLDDVMSEDNYEGPLRLVGVRAGDVVDDPAATSGFFGREAELPAVFTDLLTTHFANAPKEAVVARVESFLSKYYGQRISLQVKGVERTPKSLADVVRLPGRNLAAKPKSLADLVRLPKEAELKRQTAQPNAETDYLEKFVNIA